MVPAFENNEKVQISSSNESNESNADSLSSNPMNLTWSHVSKGEYSVLCLEEQVLMSVICLFFVGEMRRVGEGSFKMRSQ